MENMLGNVFYYIKYQILIKKDVGVYSAVTTRAIRKLYKSSKFFR